MNNFIEISLTVDNYEVREVLIAELAEVGFSGFVEEEKLLKAFINADEFKETDFHEIVNRYNVKHSKSIIKDQNWNRLWESSFKPVQVDNFCLIRAHFHPANPTIQNEIIITPKMSFGTGHHATTYLMVQQMKDLQFDNKTVADFGTGTGILGILAEKLGAKAILAIDNDGWSIENAKENIGQNCCSNIKLHQTNTFNPTEKFEIILANINRNVILDNLNGLVFGLEHGGYLLLSGLLADDESVILKASKEHNLIHVNTVEKDSWISILLQFPF